MQTLSHTKITRLIVHNYRSLADISLELSPLTVLVGPNGSGKSNIVDVLRFLSDTLKLGLDNAIVNRGGIQSLRRWSYKGRPCHITIQVQLRGYEPNEWEANFLLEIGGKRGGEYFVRQEKCEFLEGDTQKQYDIQNGKWVIHPNQGAIKKSHKTFERQLSKTNLFLTQAIDPEFKRIADALREVAVYHIQTEKIRAPQKPANPLPLLEDGSNLASVLRYLKRERSTNLQKILEVLGGITEGVRDISVALIGGHLVTHLEYANKASFPLAQESDGTLRMLGLLTALHQGAQRTLVAFEEPELNIHPGVLPVLWNEFIEASQTTQILLTTHSPDLIERITPECLRVVERKKGITTVGSVAPHQVKTIKESLFQPGEIVRIIGLQKAEELKKAEELTEV